MNKADRFEILDTFARGPMEVNERIDHFSSVQLRRWHGVGVFFLRDGKIVEWYDYTIDSDRARSQDRLRREAETHSSLSIKQTRVPEWFFDPFQMQNIPGRTPSQHFT